MSLLVQLQRQVGRRVGFGLCANLRTAPSRNVGNVRRPVNLAVEEVPLSQRVQSIPRSRLLLGAGAGLGVIALGAMGASMMNVSPAAMKDQIWPTYVHERLRTTYYSLASGLAFTAAASTAFFRMGLASRVAAFGWPGMIGLTVLTVGTAVMTQAIDPQNTVLKYACFAAFTSTIGLGLAPLAYFGGAMVLRAAAITGGIVGSLSIVAANSPSDQFLWMAGPLAMGLGAVVVSSLGAAIFPAARAAPLMWNISLYGGLALFSAFVLYDTSKIVTHAKAMPLYDPIGECIGLYLDVINIFVRIVQILAMNDRKRN